MPPHRRRVFATMRTPPPLRRSDWWNHQELPHNPHPPPPMPSPPHPSFPPALPTAAAAAAATTEMTDAPGTAAPWLPTWPPQHTDMYLYSPTTPPPAAPLAPFRDRDQATNHPFTPSAPSAPSAPAPPPFTPTPTTTTTVTLLSTAQLLDALAGHLTLPAAGGRAAWAGVDAALTALVVLGCGGARVGAVGVGACVLCYARVADCVVRPCGHLVLCERCVLDEGVGGAGKRRQVVCPVPGCGRAVEETVRTYRG